MLLNPENVGVTVAISLYLQFMATFFDLRRFQTSHSTDTVQHSTDTGSNVFLNPDTVGVAVEVSFLFCIDQLRYCVIPQFSPVMAAIISLTYHSPRRRRVLALALCRVVKPLVGVAVEIEPKRSRP